MSASVNLDASVRGQQWYILYFSDTSCNDLEIGTFQTDSFTTVLNIISVFLYLALLKRLADYDRLTHGNYSFDARCFSRSTINTFDSADDQCVSVFLRNDFGIVLPEICEREWRTKEHGCSCNCVVARNNIRISLVVMH